MPPRPPALQFPWLFSHKTELPAAACRQARLAPAARLSQPLPQLAGGGVIDGYWRQRSRTCALSATRSSKSCRSLAHACPYCFDKREFAQMMRIAPATPNREPKSASAIASRPRLRCGGHPSTSSPVPRSAGGRACTNAGSRTPRCADRKADTPLSLAVVVRCTGCATASGNSARLSVPQHGHRFRSRTHRRHEYLAPSATARPPGSTTASTARDPIRLLRLRVPGCSGCPPGRRCSVRWRRDDRQASQCYLVAYRCRDVLLQFLELLQCACRSIRPSTNAPRPGQRRRPQLSPAGELEARVHSAPPDPDHSATLPTVPSETGIAAS